MHIENLDTSSYCNLEMRYYQNSRNNNNRYKLDDIDDYFGRRLFTLINRKRSFCFHRGGVFKAPFLEKYTNGEFTHIMITPDVIRTLKALNDHDKYKILSKAKVYSIYNSGKFPKGLLPPDWKLSEQQAEAFENTQARKILPIFFGEPDDFWNNDFWMQGHYLRWFSPPPVKKKESPTSDKLLKINDRFTPMILDHEGKDLLSVKENGRTITKIGSLPGTFNADTVSSRKYLASVVREHITYSMALPAPSVYVFLWDMKRRTIHISHKATEYVLSLFKNSRRKRVGELEVPRDMAEPKDFLERLNKHFEEKGFEKLKATKAIPLVKFGCTYMEHDFIKGYMDTKVEHVDGYVVAVSYNGRPIIGHGSSSGGFIVVADNERFTMVQSAWCQRTTSWSKNVAHVVDQRYNTWDTVDWITGPFAQEHGVAIKEAPIVFDGRRPSNKSAKMERLKRQMAAQQNNINELLRQVANK